MKRFNKQIKINTNQDGLRGTAIMKISSVLKMHNFDFNYIFFKRSFAVLRIRNGQKDDPHGVASSQYRRY